LRRHLVKTEFLLNILLVQLSPWRTHWISSINDGLAKFFNILNVNRTT
jgi:hypothetical protein